MHVHGPEVTCAVEDVWPRVGLGGHGQIRALVCEGPTLLASVAGFRPEPFTERERDVFSALLPALRRSLSFRRRLVDASAPQGKLEQTLEAIGAAAFIASAAGHVMHANSAATALLERSPRATRDLVRDQIAACEDASFVARIDAPGIRECFLVVLRDGKDFEARIQQATVAWRVTAREREVLRRVVRGDSNKEIALQLQCHEGSVERHVTSLLRKSRSDSRSRLVSRFWTMI
jgi:DNA-binding CsgD family transcriptional regulator